MNLLEIVDIKIVSEMITCPSFVSPSPIPSGFAATDR